MPYALPYTTKITTDSSRKRTYKVRRASFGNGYSQSAPDGINYVKDSWAISFDLLASTERAALVNILDSIGTWDYFTWQAPGDAASKRWLVTGDWSESLSGLYYKISFNAEQTY